MDVIAKGGLLQIASGHTIWVNRYFFTISEYKTRVLGLVHTYPDIFEKASSFICKKDPFSYEKRFLENPLPQENAVIFEI